jgi:hypothetical protein
MTTCTCCEGQWYLYLQSDGHIDVTGEHQYHTTIGMTNSPLGCLAKRNHHHLYSRSKRAPSSTPPKPLQRNKVVIGPLPTPYNNEDTAKTQVQTWKSSARGLLSRMMWGVLLARRLGCSQCFVDEIDLPIVRFLLSHLSSSDSYTGTTYTALLKLYKSSAQDLRHGVGTD